MLSLLLALKFGGPALGTAAGAYGLVTKRKAYKAQKRLELLEEESRTGKFLSQFTKHEIAHTIKGYTEPSCSPTDPANSDDEAYLSDIREPVFDYMDRALFKSDQRTYTLLLADSGMGKTSFCIAYRNHLLQHRPDQDVAVISLAHPDSDYHIARLRDKSRCVLLLDALDEDANALTDGRKRLEALLESSVDFQAVVITCRSQFFADDHTIPVETPIRKVAPRALGQNHNATLKRFYLSPFDDKQVVRYINRHFPRWKLNRRSQRSRAFKLISDIPELAARPMLLERLPEIARGKEDLRELYQLYEFMVLGWAHREKNWIPEDKLLAVSREIAVSSFAKRGHRAERLTKNELQNIANRLIENDPDWDHLQTRSLLNRDSNGLFKFAHLSILEFFVVEAALEGDSRALLWPWTGFMKQLFISWGYYRHDVASIDKARSILTSPEARKAILPLSDYWAMPPKQGLPNFKMSATRRSNEFGSSRLAIPQWRKANISVKFDDGEISVDDHEFFISWHASLDILDGHKRSPMTLIRAQQLGSSSTLLRFPSYDEFVSLVEGLDSVEANHLLQDSIFYPISDSPGERRHLLVSLGKCREVGSLAKVLDKERIVSVTDRAISCYETGQAQDPRYGARIMVQPWWVDQH
jgi:hypothetical protein